MAGEGVADELYGLAPSEFTSARDAKAAELRKQGARDEAKAVKALRKPTSPAWALNQVARRRAEDVEALLASGRRLQEAQEALLAGGDRAALKGASEEQRALVSQLMQQALAVAREAGIGTGTSFEEKVAETLRAAALDEEVAEELRRGRLVRERAAVGVFGEPAAGAPQRKRASRGTSRRAGRTAKGEVEKAPEADEARQRELERLMDEAAGALARAERELDKAGRAARSAEKRAEAAGRRADEARAKADDETRKLREAKAREAEAAAEVDELKSALGEAERALR
jgi:hypothetical protein